MYGEEKPSEKLIFDSAVFRQGIEEGLGEGELTDELTEELTDELWQGLEM